MGLVTWTPKGTQQNQLEREVHYRLHTDVHDEIAKNALVALINDADVSPWFPPSSRLKQSIITVGGQIWPQARSQPQTRSRNHAF